MKKRHILMIITVVLFALVMFSIKDSKNTKTLTCSVNGEFYEMESVTTLKAKVNNNKVRSMFISIDVIIPEEYKDYKQNLISQMKASGKMQVESTSKGIRLSTGTNKYFDSLGLNRDSSYSELKSALELQGYSCE